MPCDLTCLGTIRRFAGELAADAGLDEDQTYNLKVALSEACANAVEHGIGARGTIEVTAHAFPDRVRVEVNSRSGFQVAGERRAIPQHRGLGIPLMVTLTDEFCITRNRGGGTTVALTLYRRDEPPG